MTEELEPKTTPETTIDLRISVNGYEVPNEEVLAFLEKFAAAILQRVSANSVQAIPESTPMLPQNSALTRARAALRRPIREIFGVVNNPGTNPEVLMHMARETDFEKTLLKIAANPAINEETMLFLAEYKNQRMNLALAANNDVELSVKALEALIHSGDSAVMLAVVRRKQILPPEILDSLIGANNLSDYGAVLAGRADLSPDHLATLILKHKDNSEMAHVMSHIAFRKDISPEHLVTLSQPTMGECVQTTIAQRRSTLPPDVIRNLSTSPHKEVRHLLAYRGRRGDTAVEIFSEDVLIALSHDYYDQTLASLAARRGLPLDILWVLFNKNIPIVDQVLRERLYSLPKPLQEALKQRTRLEILENQLRRREGSSGPERIGDDSCNT